MIVGCGFGGLWVNVAGFRVWGLRVWSFGVSGFGVTAVRGLRSRVQGIDDRPTGISTLARDA